MTTHFLRTIFVIAAIGWCTFAQSQYAWQEGAEAGRHDLLHNLHYKLELQGAVSRHRTPLWMNANRYGLSSLESANGYLRGSISRPLSTDSARRWGIGYGIDVAVASHFTSKLVVQQAFAEVRWLHGVLTVGSKEWPMELKNQRLSSGPQTLGINARPVPQVRLALPRYWVVPGLDGWLRLKGHIAYGRLTDNRWQRDFSLQQNPYAQSTLYHSKAGYLMIGNPDRFLPFSLELGLESAALFGGKSYINDGKGGLREVRNAQSLKSFLHAFIPGGGDVPEQETVYQNEEGDLLGSWVVRLNYEADTWRLGIYADKFFEDHSSMFQLDYNGYGEGDEWNRKKHHRYHLYDFKDWMIGVELNFKYSRWIRDIVAEYLYTKYQSGPVYHDHSQGRGEHISGRDNFYNHYIYSGWQHWGQVMGNPLYRSPLYNDDHQIEVENNRFMALHLGIDGNPTEQLSYRLLASWQEGLGTYERPYDKKHHNFSFLVEASYDFPHQWKLTGAYGMDFGHILGNNAGFQLTLAKTGVFDL